MILGMAIGLTSYPFATFSDQNPGDKDLLLESGGHLLTEDSDKLVQES